MTDEFAGWAVLELMGHRRLAGYVVVVELAGSSFFRIDIPGVEDEAEATQFYSASSLYCLTPTTEEICRQFAAQARPRPVQRWELEPPREPMQPVLDDDGERPF